MELKEKKNSISLTEIREITGLSSDTIRYYEKEELITNIKRLPNGHRIYSSHDLEWLKFINCLKSTGMKLKKIKEYKELMDLGDNTVVERGQILSDQKKSILNEMEQLNKALNIIDYKIKYYKEVEETIK